MRVWTRQEEVTFARPCGPGGSAHAQPPSGSMGEIGERQQVPMIAYKVSMTLYGTRGMTPVNNEARHDRFEAAARDGTTKSDREANEQGCIGVVAMDSREMSHRLEQTRPRSQLVELRRAGIVAHCGGHNAVSSFSAPAASTRSDHASSVRSL
jgi:hypothetical protein